jgi:hypothetical protein
MFPIARNIAYIETFSGGNPLPSERQLQLWLPGRLRERLPSSWSIRLAGEQAPAGQGGDALLFVSDSSGQTAQVVVEVKRYVVSPRETLAIIAQLKRYLPENASAIVVAPFIGPRAQALLAAAHLNYLDATGNLRLQLDRPTLYIAEQGATHNPWTESTVQQSLRGPAAGRVVRALCDIRPPYGVRELAECAETPPGTVSKILGLLDREALIQRTERGKYRGEIVAVDWVALLKRWTQDYHFETTNKVETYIEPRGLDMLFAQLRKWKQAGDLTHKRFAVTGSFASLLYAPIVQPRLVTLYVDDIAAAVATLGLRPSDRGTNVLLATPFDPVVFARATEREGIIYSTVAQVAADLLTGSGRGPQEGAALLQWMEAHEDDWRQ